MRIKTYSTEQTIQYVSNFQLNVEKQTTLVMKKKKITNR